MSKRKRRQWLESQRASVDTDMDLTCRALALRAATVNEEHRSVEATISTERAVEVMDWREWEPIDEVLMVDGVELPRQIPLLSNHSRWSLSDVLGSAREIRVERGEDGSSIVARLSFARDDEDAERAWNKVRQGHITDVSVGYRVLESVEIQPKQSAVVSGRTFTAGQRRLRVATRWALREVSVVPIGADTAAKMRGELDMRKELRAYLESIGLRADASEQDAIEFVKGLKGEQQKRASELEKEPPTITDPTRAAPPPTAPPADPADAARAAVKAERERVRAIEDLAGDEIPQELVREAIDKEWTVDQASRAFLKRLREDRASGVGPAIHSRGHDTDCTQDSLASALMLRAGVDPTKRRGVYEEGTFRPRPNMEKDEAVLRAADNAWKYRDMSLVDICREACRLDGKTVPSSRSEAIRTAVSGSSLSAIFTTNVSAQLLSAYMDATDTTMGWVSESDLPDFKTAERAMMGKFGALQKLGRGGTADHLNASDSKEQYKLARYAGQFVVDEQDIIDDRFGAIEQMSPVDIGLTARQLRPNLVYSILLANAALGADSVALFHSTHANTTTGALTAATLQTTLQLLAKQRQNNRPLNIRGRYVIVPQDLLFTARIIIQSAQRIISADSGGTFNPLADYGLTVVSDDRIGVAGVTDPSSGTAYTGTATNYFVAARPGEEGAKTIEVGYLRGTGRAPQLRGFTLDKGQWGVGWDINMDIGAKALDYRAMAFSTGA